MQSGGTREKYILERPEDGKIFYFKTSKRVYPTEFWMEIVASAIGRSWGLDVLEYHVAQHAELFGCISENMISQEGEELRELKSYLVLEDSSYNPSAKEHQSRYTFEFIARALRKQSLDDFLPKIIETIVFDAVIGNQDRHQENIAFIVNADSERFSQIYDSGSCLGRELSEERVSRMSANSKDLSFYIERGHSEIRWDGPKISHSKLLQHLLATQEYEGTTKASILKIVERFDAEETAEIIEHIDDALPPDFGGTRLTPERKIFIAKLITARIDCVSTLLG